MENVNQIKELLSRVKYASMATVNHDGTPHNSPLVFLYDHNLEYIFWGSHPESQHSQNILRTGQSFFVAFDSVNGSTGLYIQAEDGQMVDGGDLTQALEVHNHFRAKMGKDVIGISYYIGDSPQRMWRAKVNKVWVNAYERGSDGRLVKDFKIEINPEELVGLWD